MDEDRRRPAYKETLAQAPIGRHHVGVAVALQASAEGGRVHAQVVRQTPEVAGGVAHRRPPRLAAEDGVVVVVVAVLVAGAAGRAGGKEGVGMLVQGEVVEHQLRFACGDVRQIQLRLDLEGEGPAGRALVVAELHDRDGGVRVPPDDPLSQVDQLLVADLAQLDGRAGRLSAVAQGERHDHDAEHRHHSDRQVELGQVGTSRCSLSCHDPLAFVFRGITPSRTRGAPP